MDDVNGIYAKQLVKNRPTYWKRIPCILHKKKLFLSFSTSFLSLSLSFPGFAFNKRFATEIQFWFLGCAGVRFSLQYTRTIFASWILFFSFFPSFVSIWLKFTNFIVLCLGLCVCARVCEREIARDRKRKGVNKTWEWCVEHNYISFIHTRI